MSRALACAVPEDRAGMPVTGTDGVRVWHLRQPAFERFARSDWLCPAERERAGRFRFAADRARFVAGRAALRLLLGRALGTAPEGVEFAYGPYGKPYVEAPGAPFFSVSHSGDHLLLAFCRRPVGVDIETPRTGIDFLGIARGSFAPAEYARLRGAADPAALFLRTWTRKEACLKLLGTGLARPTDDFDTGPDSVALCAAAGAESVRIALTTVALADGCTLSVAVAGERCPVLMAPLTHPDAAPHPLPQTHYAR